MARKRPVLLLLAATAAIFLGAAGYLAAEPSYTVYDGETPLVVNGRFATVADVLTAAGLDLRPQDIVTPESGEAADPDTVIQVQRARAVTVRSERGTQTYWTQRRLLSAFLFDIGQMPRRTDQVTADGLPVSFGDLGSTPLPQVVEIGRFLTITIQENNQQRTVRTAAQTVGAALQEAGVTVYAADSVQPPPGEWLEPGMTIRVQRSFPVKIVVDGRSIQTRTAQTSVLDALAEAGIGLVGLDFTRPPAGSAVQPNSVIEVIRVTEDFRLEDEPIPYQTLWQASDELEIDQRAVISYGEPGVKQQRIRIRYENGVEVSQSVDGEWVAKEPVNEVIGYGTKIVIRTVDTPQGPRDYWRVVRMRVTSYTAASSGRAPDDPRYGITASGRQAGYGVVAIDRSVVPFRSELYVPGYGVGFAGDTGGGVRGRWIDLGYDEDNYRAWSGYVDVYYLTPVPSPDNINYLLPSGLP